VIRALVWIALIVGFVWFGSTVRLGNKTFFGHVRAIWHTEEAQELKDGVKEKAGPAASKLKRGIEAGYNAMKDDGGQGAGSATGSGAPAPAHH
jgi:hypothetical protein